VVVWEWKLWDHLVQDQDNALPAFGVVSAHPELVDINFVQGPATSPDWIHLNSVSYNPDLDQVLVSSHNLDEFWVIDHGTTTAEAAGHTGGARGHGGDLLYRWGNARSQGLGTVADQRLFGQHHATWLPAGHPFAGSILVFNNGLGRPGNDYSSLEIITPPTDGNGNYTFLPGQAYGPGAAAWTWTMPTPTDLFAQNISGVLPVADGYLVTDGPRGRVFQLDALGDERWAYINPVGQNGPMTQGAVPQGNNVFHYEFYPPDFDGFDGLTLVPGDPIEVDPLTTPLCILAGMPQYTEAAACVFPNPATDEVTVSISSEDVRWLEVVDALGRSKQRKQVSVTGTSFELDGLPPGLYTVVAQGTDGRPRAIGRFIKQAR
jgi:hypothetical protein